MARDLDIEGHVNLKAMKLLNVLPSGRFRYKSELPKVQELLKGPKLQIEIEGGCSGLVKAVVTAVCADREKLTSHPHQLYSRGNEWSEEQPGVLASYFHTSENQLVYHLPSVFSYKTKNKEAKKKLESRAPLLRSMDIIVDSSKQDYNIEAFKLAVLLFKDENLIGIAVSHPICDTTGDWSITSINPPSGSVSGGTKIKIFTSDFRPGYGVVFEAEDWKVSADVCQAEIRHHQKSAKSKAGKGHVQTSLSFEAPPFRNLDVQQPVDVKIYLTRIVGTREERSVGRTFTYTPQLEERSGPSLSSKRLKLDSTVLGDLEAGAANSRDVSSSLPTDKCGHQVPGDAQPAGMPLALGPSSLLPHKRPRRQTPIGNFNNFTPPPEASGSIPGTGAANSPVIPFSVLTGEGKNQLEGQCEYPHERLTAPHHPQASTSAASDTDLQFQGAVAQPRDAHMCTGGWPRVMMPTGEVYLLCEDDDGEPCLILDKQFPPIEDSPPSVTDQAGPLRQIDSYLGKQGETGTAYEDMVAVPGGSVNATSAMTGAGAEPGLSAGLNGVTGQQETSGQVVYRRSLSNTSGQEPPPPPAGDHFLLDSGNFSLDLGLDSGSGGTVASDGQATVAAVNTVQSGSDNLQILFSRNSRNTVPPSQATQPQTGPPNYALDHHQSSDDSGHFSFSQPSMEEVPTDLRDAPNFEGPRS